MDIRKIKDNKYQANELIESIFEFKREKCEGLSLMETLIEYSFKFDIPLQEVGNVISEHKEFIKILEHQLEKDGYIRTEETELDSMEMDADEW